jgi:hypothetical protein
VELAQSPPLIHFDTKHVQREGETLAGRTGARRFLPRPPTGMRLDMQ